MENQTAYYPPVQPAGILQTKPQTDIAAREKIARKFCFISLGFFSASILFSLARFASDRFLSNTDMFYIGKMYSYLGTSALTVAEALMIVARIKCKESRFGKTLMWVYIVYIAIRYIAYAAAIGFLLYIIGKMAI